MKFKSKILIILLLALTIFFISSNVYASGGYETCDFSSEVIEYIKNLPAYSQYDYFLCKYFEGDAMHNVDCYFFNDADVHFYLGDLDNQKVLYASKYFDCYHASFRIEDYYFLGGANRNTNIGSYIKPFSDGKYRVFSNVNIYTDHTLTDFFFQPSVTLLTPMTVEEVPGMINKILIILVPAGLIICGLLLAPYLLKYRN